MPTVTRSTPALGLGLLLCCSCGLPARGPATSREALSACTGGENRYDDHGTGAPADPFLLCTAAQVIHLMGAGVVVLNKDFKLGQDIDLTGFDQSNGILPIGPAAASTPYVGTFDGDGHVIDHLTYASNLDEIGFFSAIDGPGEVKNLTLSNVSLTSTYFYDVGAVAGTTGNNSPTITNCHSSGTMVTTNPNNTAMGGILGWAGGYGISTATPMGTVTITDSSSSATVNGNNPASGGAGGLLGTCRAASCVIARSSASGSITSTKLAGGLVGTGANTTITDSYSTATVSGGSLVGGLVGSGAPLSITSSYASGTVSAGTNGSAGGLIGAGSPQQALSAAFAVNTVSCTVGLGVPDAGRCAPLAGGAGVAAGTGSYFDGQATCFNDGSGGCLDLTGATAVPAGMAYFFNPANAPLSGWNFSTIWFSHDPVALPTLRPLLVADAGAPDAGAGDAGPADAGPPDAGAPDAGAADAGLPDGGVPDAGPSEGDAGTSPGPRFYVVGCSSAGAGPAVLFLLVVLARRR